MWAGRVPGGYCVVEKKILCKKFCSHLAGDGSFREKKVQRVLSIQA